MRSLRLIAATIIIASVAYTQVILPAKTPFERRGLYHAAIHGRFVSPSGEPVAGVHVQLRAGAPRSLPVVAVVTGGDGQFRMTDVNSSYSPYISWFPPEEWYGGGASAVGESATEVDIGVIRLRPATIFRVSVEGAGEANLPPDQRDPAVTVQLKSANGSQVFAERVGSEQILRGVSFDEGTWMVELYSKAGTEVYTAPFHGQLDGRNRKFTLRLLRDSLRRTRQYLQEGKLLVVSESTVDATSTTREYVMAGKVVGPDGSPIEGAIVSNFSHSFRELARKWVRTGSQGDFNLSYRATNCIAPSVTYGDSDYWNLFFSKSDLRRLTCEEWSRTSHTILMPKPTQLAFHVSGTDASNVRAYWWHDSFGWQRFSSLRPWVPAWGLFRAQVKVEADGYLPLTQKLEFPRLDPSKDEPPAELPLEFLFNANVRRTLSVLSAGKPLAGAIVDVESIVNLDSDQRIRLGSYRLPADGRLELLGGGDQLIELFVYREGFEPRRAVWNVGSPLALDLVPRNSTLEFPAASAAVVARIRKADSPRGARTVFLSANKPTSAPVVPGTYDITCYEATASIAGYQRLRVAAGSSATVNCAKDQRPRLTVRFPGEGWRLSVWETTPRGGATEWVAMIPVPGTPGFADVAATPLSKSTTEPVLALSHAGRWHVEARAENRTLRLWREIDIQPGASMTLVLPKNTGTLKGSMRTYSGGLELAIHGFAGPRMQLLADDPTGWSVTEYIPQRNAKMGTESHRFSVTGIPAGSYHLYQHLIGESKTMTFGRETVAYTRPTNAWGGIPVKLAANAATEIRDFIEYPLNDLHVRVTDAGGRPVERATLRIRDRMSESWRQVEENPGQLEEASHPIPYPAATRIVGGKATLPNIREGWLDLLVESDTGVTFSFTVPVSPQRELTLTLP